MVQVGTSQAFLRNFMYNSFIGVIMNIIAERIKSLRMEAKLSARQVGAGIGVAHSTIIRWEHGSRVPDALDLIALAKFFNVSIDYICGLEN